MHSNSRTWRKVKLEDITTKIGSGATPRGGQGAYHQEGMPLIRSLNIYDLNFSYDDLAFIDESQAEQLANVTVEKDDVLLNITGASVCRCTTVPDNLVPARVNQHVSIIRADRKNLNGKYLKYALVSPLYKRALYGLATNGATREALTKSNIENFEINLPDISTQSRIASVLSAYDDLIENNEKRIKVLEEMAQRLYTEWFVKFKFPGHEKVRMIESGTEYGRIPEGWGVGSTQECFNVLGGGTPSRTVPSNWNYGSINWFTPTDITRSGQMFLDESSEKITESGLKTSSARLFPPYSIMMTSRATIGAISINTAPASTNQGFIVCLPNKKVPLHYLYYWLCSKVSSFIDMATGATFKELSKGAFKNIQILLPAESALKDFERKVESIGKTIFLLQKQVQTLSRTRDLLIPQLVTGKRGLRTAA